VRNKGDGIALDSVQVPTAPAESALERKIRGLHDGFYVTKKHRAELKAKSVACATPARCEVTSTIGAVYGYDVSGGGENVQSRGGHWTGDALAAEILALSTKQPKLEGSRVVCAGETPFEIGRTTRCEATLATDETLKIAVKITSDETGDFSFDY
jgi:hypothetical protein